MQIKLDKDNNYGSVICKLKHFIKFDINWAK